MNTVNLVGRITNDPSLRYTNPGTAVCEFRIAVESRRDEHTDFVPIVTFGKQAEAVADHTSKGSLVAVTGSITSSDWTDDHGERHFRLQITAHQIKFLDRRPLASAGGDDDLAAAS